MDAHTTYWPSLAIAGYLEFRVPSYLETSTACVCVCVFKNEINSFVAAAVSDYRPIVVLFPNKEEPKEKNVARCAN